MNTKTKDITLMAMCCTMTIVLSQIAIPLPITPVPISLATLAVFMSGALLGARRGAISQIIYLLIGAIGIPVFAKFTSGIGILLGPTGGYIFGYIIAAFLIGLIINKMPTKFYIYPIAMTIGLTTCYMLGTVWFMFQTKTGFVASLSVCVFPFLIGDLLKILLGSTLSYRLKFIIYHHLYLCN